MNAAIDARPGRYGSRPAADRRPREIGGVRKTPARGRPPCTRIPRRSGGRARACRACTHLCAHASTSAAAPRYAWPRAPRRTRPCTSRDERALAAETAREHLAADARLARPARPAALAANDWRTRSAPTCSHRSRRRPPAPACAARRGQRPRLMPRSSHARGRARRHAPRALTSRLGPPSRQPPSRPPGRRRRSASGFALASARRSTPSPAPGAWRWTGLGPRQQLDGRCRETGALARHHTDPAVGAALLPGAATSPRASWPASPTCAVRTRSPPNAPRRLIEPARPPRRRPRPHVDSARNPCSSSTSAPAGHPPDGGQPAFIDTALSPPPGGTSIRGRCLRAPALATPPMPAADRQRRLRALALALDPCVAVGLRGRGDGDA